MADMAKEVREECLTYGDAQEKDAKTDQERLGALITDILNEGMVWTDWEEELDFRIWIVDPILERIRC